MGQSVSRHCGRRMSNEVMQTLRGRIIRKPRTQKWFKNSGNDTYEYTCETEADWTPFNSNLVMKGIKVVEKDPTPVKVEDPVEDTLMILGMLKDIKRQEKEKDKAKLIYKL